MDHADMMRMLSVDFSSISSSPAPSLESVGWNGPGKKGWRRRDASESLAKGDVFLHSSEGYEVVNKFEGRSASDYECWTKSEPPKPVKRVTWDDVIGLEAAKSELQEAIEAPYKHADIFEAFDMKPTKGVLLYGPPGCGKTMLGKAAASSVAQIHGKNSTEGFFYFSGPDMYGPHVGDEQRKMNEAFDKGETHFKRHGYPAVLFFDECDSMLPDRNHSPRFAVDLVNTFLTRMDGINECHSFVLLATNSHHKLDAAAIREGRIDRKIYVGAPERNAVEAILVSAFMGKPLQKGSSPASFATLLADRLFHESALIGEDPLSSFLNGANVTGLATRATQFAFRDAVANRKAGEKADHWITVHHADLAFRAFQAEIREMVLKTPSDVMNIKIEHRIESQDEGDKWTT